MRRPLRTTLGVGVSAALATLVSSMKTTAHKYTFGAPYESGSLGTTSFDKGYGLVDVVAAAQSLAP